MLQEQVLAAKATHLVVSQYKRVEKEKLNKKENFSTFCWVIILLL